MGFFDMFFKQASKTVAKSVVNEMSKTTKQKDIEKIERGLGVKIDPDSYQTFSESEYQEHIKNEQHLEEQMLDRLCDAAYGIIETVWDYQEDYMAGRMLKGDFRKELDNGYEALKKEVLSSSSSIDSEGLLSLTDKMEIYERNKKHLDYLKFTWLPNN